MEAQGIQELRPLQLGLQGWHVQPQGCIRRRGGPRNWPLRPPSREKAVDEVQLGPSEKVHERVLPGKQRSAGMEQGKGAACGSGGKRSPCTLRQVSGQVKEPSSEPSKLRCVLGKTALVREVSPRCRTQKLSGTLSPNIPCFWLMGYKKLPGLRVTEWGFARDGQYCKLGWPRSLRRQSLISSRDFRHLITAEISGSLACAHHRGLVYSSESLRGLSGGTARCVCNLLYDLFAWDAFPEGQQCLGGLWPPAARAASRVKSPVGHRTALVTPSPAAQEVPAGGGGCGAPH